MDGLEEELANRGLEDLFRDDRPPPITVASLIRKTILEPYGLAIKDVAKLFGMDLDNIRDVMIVQRDGKQRRRCTVFTALKLEKLTGRGALGWLMVQAQLDIYMAKRDPHVKEMLDRIPVLPRLKAKRKSSKQKQA